MHFHNYPNYSDQKFLGNLNAHPYSHIPVES
jgi:hypothetical protein